MGFQFKQHISRRRFAAVIVLSIFLSSNHTSVQAAPEYPPTIGGCERQSTVDFTINTTNISAVRTKLSTATTVRVTTSRNRAHTFLLSGIKTGSRVSINIVLPSKKRLDLKPSLLSTGGIVCPTNFIFKKTGTYLITFTSSKIKRSVNVTVKK